MKNKDYSVGIIPVAFEGEKRLLYLVKSKRGGYWGFPKGHPEAGELPKEAALRELKEETSLEIETYLSPKTLSEYYSYEKNGETIEKQVDYWLAKVKEGQEAKVDGKEIAEGKWVVWEEALTLITYPESKRVALEVGKIIQD